MVLDTVFTRIARRGYVTRQDLTMGIFERIPTAVERVAAALDKTPASLRDHMAEHRLTASDFFAAFDRAFNTDLSSELDK